MTSTRSSSGASRPVTITPVPRTATPAGAGSMRAQPVSSSPGSMPRTRSPLGGGDGLEDLVGDVVIGVDGLEVVQLLQRLDQAQHAGRVLVLDPTVDLGHERSE